MALDRTEVTGEDGGPIRVEFDAAMKKIYGPVVEAEVVSHQVSVISAQPARPAEIEKGGPR